MCKQNKQYHGLYDTDKKFTQIYHLFLDINEDKYVLEKTAKLWHYSDFHFEELLVFVSYGAQHCVV